MSTDNAWVVSDDEELWTCSEEFATEQEAIAYALGAFADEYNIEPGMTVFVGQKTTEETGPKTLAEYVVSAERVVEDVEERLYELLGPDVVDTELHTTKEQLADLDTRLATVVEAWLREHALVPSCFTVNKVTSHVVPARSTE